MCPKSQLLNILTDFYKSQYKFRLTGGYSTYGQSNSMYSGLTTWRMKELVSWTSAIYFTVLQLSMGVHIRWDKNRYTVHSININNYCVPTFGAPCIWKMCNFYEVTFWSDCNIRTRQSCQHFFSSCRCYCGNWCKRGDRHIDLNVVVSQLQTWRRCENFKVNMQQI